MCGWVAASFLACLVCLVSMGRKVVFSSVPPLFNLCFSFVRFARFSEFARSSFVLFSLFSLCSLSVKGQKKRPNLARCWFGRVVIPKKNLRPHLGLFWGCFPCFVRASFFLFSLCSLFVRVCFFFCSSFVRWRVFPHFGLTSFLHIGRNF